MNDFLITSESYIKNATPIFDGVAGKYMEVAIREAQEINIKSIIGSRLLSKIKQIGMRGDFNDDENVHYKELIDQLQPVIAWIVCAKVARATSYKLTNKGVIKTSDDRVINASFDEVIKAENDFMSKADFFTYEVQKYLLANRSWFPELSECDCEAIHANLTSAATCGLWLGGVRGKIEY